MRGEQYLTKPQQYTLVYRKGGSWRSDLLVMRALPNGLALSRYGLSVSKRVSKKAVTRNRVKRLLREILRVMPLNPGWDIVFIARPPAASVDYSCLQKSVEDLLSLSHIVKTDDKRGLTGEMATPGGGELAV